MNKVYGLVLIKVGASRNIDNEYDDGYEEDSAPPPPLPQQRSMPNGKPQPNRSNGAPKSIDNIPIGGGGGGNFQIAESAGSVNLRPCPKCGRKFAGDRLPVHMNACGNEKKRKVFDVTKMRVQGTDAESFLRKKRPAPEPKVIKRLYLSNGFFKII